MTVGCSYALKLKSHGGYDQLNMIAIGSTMVGERAYHDLSSTHQNGTTCHSGMAPLLCQNACPTEPMIPSFLTIINQSFTNNHLSQPPATTSKHQQQPAPTTFRNHQQPPATTSNHQPDMTVRLFALRGLWL